MQRLLLFLLGCTLSFGLGFAASTLRDTPARASVPRVDARPAYLIVSGRILHPEQMGAYYEAAGPLARQAGYRIVAGGNTDEASVHVLEGRWPFEGVVLIEQYDSMEALTAFWNSPAFEAAKKLREGHADLDFIIAVEGEE